MLLEFTLEEGGGRGYSILEDLVTQAANSTSGQKWPKITISLLPVFQSPGSCIQDYQPGKLTVNDVVLFWAIEIFVKKVFVGQKR